MASVDIKKNEAARLNFRLPAEIKKRVERAAMASGITVTDFAVSALATSADEVKAGKNEILGYYTLSSGSVSFENVPEKLPRYPTPTAHLRRLAVDIGQKGKGLGELLLIDGLARVGPRVHASGDICC